MNDGFYRAFEERYYAPREVIKGLRKQYLPFTQQLAETYAGSSTFDAGCGRGEWLELMIEQGFQPLGVDLDDGMLLACTELQLPAYKGDAIADMSSLTSESQAVVSAFHVVEHVPFEQLRKFVSEALRVLKPGGLLIMETPNPENLAVSTRNFYLDPTHQRPIPPQLLAFVTEFEGFERVKTLRLQEPKDIAGRETIGLTEVINCVSPDYAVIAQKKADSSLMAAMQDLFDTDYGICLDELTNKIDQRLLMMENHAAQAFNLAQQAEVKAQQAEVKAQQAENTMQQLYASKSCRLTAPLRWVVRQAALLKQEGLKSRVKALIKKAIRKIDHELFMRPVLRRKIYVLCNRFGIFSSLKSLSIKAHAQTASEISLPTARHSGPRIANSEQMNVREFQIYTDLKMAIEKNRDHL